MANDLIKSSEARERIIKAAREGIEKECPEIDEAIKTKAIECVLEEFGLAVSLTEG